MISAQTQPHVRPESFADAFVDFLAKYSSLALSQTREWLSARKASHADTTKLRIMERIAIGDKNFLAVVHVDGRRLLVGSGQSGLSLLTELQPLDSFRSVVENTAVTAKPRPRKIRAASVVSKGAAA